MNDSNLRLIAHITIPILDIITREDTGYIVIRVVIEYSRYNITKNMMYATIAPSHHVAIICSLFFI